MAINLTRRSLVGAAATGMVLAAASVPAAGADPANPVALPEGISAADVAASAVELGPVTDFAEEHDYDIVVVGAGCAGLLAVMTALEEGATVGCLQKEAQASANGFSASAICNAASTPGGKKRYMMDWSEVNGWRLNTKLFEYWMDHAEETLSFFHDRCDAAGVEVIDTLTDNAVVYENGDIAANFYMVTWNALAFPTLAEKAEADGAEFFYETPAVQLVVSDEGRVTGAVGKRADGSYVKLNAAKAVILAAGDYQNNEALVRHYNRDIDGWWCAQQGRTGDGLIMGCAAGGHVTGTPHAKQVHTGFATGFFFLGPYLTLDTDGVRFMDEEGVHTVWNSQFRNYFIKRKPEVFRFFDSALEEKYPGTGTLAYADELIATAPEAALYKFVKADTLEELVDLLGAPREQTLASIERYNELCAKGSDEDFGKDPQYMQPLDTPPYYGEYFDFGVAAIDAGLEVNEFYQVVDEDRQPVAGLYAVGTNGGDVCGGINWQMPQGLSNGHCYNAGRYSVIHALTGGLVPGTVHTFESHADLYRAKDANGKLSWEEGAATPARREIPVW